MDRSVGTQFKKEWTLFHLPSSTSGTSWSTHSRTFLLRSHTRVCPPGRCGQAQFSPCMQKPRKKQSWQMVSSEAQSSSALESTERLSSSTMEPLREWLRSQSQQVSARLIWLLTKMSSVPSSPFHIFWVSTCSDLHPADLYLISASAAYPAFRLFMFRQQIKIIQTTIHSTINYILPSPLAVSVFVLSLLYLWPFWNSGGHQLLYKA